MGDLGEATKTSCPRCGHPADERFYGPCLACRDELALTMCTEARELAGGSYVPKMNVVPNHVATKD